MTVLDQWENRTPPRTSTAWMNPARSLAIVAVVAIHLLAVTVESEDVGTAPWWTANVMDAGLRWCVPVFLMISGALALDPHRGVQPRTFLIKRWYRIGVPLVFWTAFYVWFRLEVLGGADVGWDPVRALMSGSPFVQLYFLYVLAGLTLLTPMLRVVTAHGSRRTQLWTAVVLMAFGVVDQATRYGYSVGSPNIVTIFLPMMGYYLLGWVLRDVILGARATALVAAFWLLSSGSVAVVAALAPGDTPWRYVYDYLSVPVVISSVTGYLLLHRCFDGGVPVLSWLAPLSFGVFLIHPVLVFGLRLEIGVPHSVAGVLVHGIGLTVLYTVASAALTWVAVRIPFVRGLFGATRPDRAANPALRRVADGTAG